MTWGSDPLTQLLRGCLVASTPETNGCAARREQLLLKT